MEDEYAILLEKFQKVLKHLMYHTKEPNCTHSIPQLLDELEFENE